MSLDFLIMAISSIAMLILGLLVFIRNPRLKINQLFAFLAVSIISWTLFNYLSVIFPTNGPVTRLVFTTGVLTALSIITFLASFPVDSPVTKHILVKIHRVFGIILLPMTFLPQFISKVTETEIETSYLYYLFLVFILFSVFLIFYVIRKQFKNATTVAHKMQIRLVAWGVIVYAVFAVIANVILPLFVQDWTSSRIGPIFSLIFIGMVAYAIVKHRLFDIRLIIARSLAYIATLGAIGLIYGGLAFALIGGVFFSTNAKLSMGQEAAYTLLAILLVFTLNPIKHFFDRLTNTLFYRDAYDPQRFIDEFNKILVGNIDLQPLLTSSAKIIEDTLKADYCYFVIQDSNSTKMRAMGTKRDDPTPEDLHEITELVTDLKKKLVVGDELDARNAKLQGLLQTNNVAIVARLVVTANQQKGQNLLILGNKKSGNPYNKQDQRILEIITNELVIAIQNALRFEEIQQFNITLQEKVDEATRQLRRTNEKLKQLDETKDEFISMASHQLRTPLTSMKGYVSMVLEGDSGKITGTQRKLLDQAFVSSQRMVYLIADLLNVSRLRTGKFIIENKPTNLADVVDTEISQLIETAKGRGLELTYDKPKDFPTVMLDETKIRQVIMNFADNAIYYTPTGGHIKVVLKDHGDTIEYNVIDDGLGVPKAEQHHLFTKFFRAGNARKARPDGTGLGLFMAKKVVVAQGGAIVFRSEEGKGSTFGFTFAKSALPPVPKSGVVAAKTDEPPSEKKAKPAPKPAAKSPAKHPAKKSAK